MTYRRDGLRFRSEEWADCIAVDEKGWSAFQDRCRSELTEIVGAEQSPQGVEHISPNGQSGFIGEIPGSSKKYWIYTDGAQVEGYGTLEHWDFETPSRLIATFIEQVSAEMQSNNSLNADAGKAGAG